MFRFWKKDIEKSLIDNPDQPDLWLKLSDEKKERRLDALTNALIYSKGSLLMDVFKRLKPGDNLEPYLNKIDKSLGNDYANLLEGFSLRKAEPSKARNFLELSSSSNNPNVSFLSNYELALIYESQGLNDLAYELVRKIEPNIPKDFENQVKDLKVKLEKVLGKSKGIFQSLKQKLKRTKEILSFSDLMGKKVDESVFNELEERLILADVGVKTTNELLKYLKKQKAKTSDELIELLKERLEFILSKCKGSLNVSSKPSVILVLGVNGVGKTTTIAKIAKKLKDEGKSVVLAAGDTFRAAATEQLGVWANRIGVRMISGGEGSDPASVVFDAVQSIKAKNNDVLIVDTAGRLQNKKDLMEEVKKIKKVISKSIPGEPSEILLVLDANTGQNALSQAKVFKEMTDITGIVLTKLDGTAKGGIIVAICNELKIPVKYIGTGESIDDLRKFDPILFVKSLFS